MARLFEANSILDAWKSVSDELLSDNYQKNIIIEIANPCDFQSLPSILMDHNPSDVTGNFNSDNIKNVINTIFPYKVALRFNNRQIFYDHYISVHSKAKKIRKQRWGTYFERLINFPKSAKKQENLNQLENAISALNGNSKCKNYI
jgi:hypothetical protein